MTRAIKNISVLLAAVLLLAGCTGQLTKITKLEDLEGKTVANMAVPVPVERLKASVEESAGVTIRELLYFDSFQAALAALKSGKTDAVMALEPVADYYVGLDEDLSSILLNKAEGTYRMALRAEDAGLLTDINVALRSWSEDGTLDVLRKEYVTGLTSDKQFEGKDMPYFDDAPTLYVGLSGDNPPVDYIAADGNPAGYNVELLYKLSEALHVNFEIKVMPLETKFPALVSNKIDIFFLHAISDEVEATTQTMAENSGISLTDPYYTYDSMMLLVLK